MLICADQDIPDVRNAFAQLGDICLLPNDGITRKAVANATIVLVRSQTKVDRSLLQGSNVRFVASATAGIDHVDQDYLRKAGIGFAHAPGSNANSVAEYVLAALLCLSRRRREPLSGKRIGIVGVGQVGSRVARFCQALGMHVLLNDPPKQRQTHSASFLPLRHLLEADFITLHVPLTHSGPDATYHLFDRDRLAELSRKSVLLNTSRGAVVETNALKQLLQNKMLGGAVIDVWENEPEIDLALLRQVDIATSHIAGYSWDGKRRGTGMILQATRKFFGIKPAAAILTSDQLPSLSRQAPPRCPDDAFLENLLKKFYDIEQDDARLRRIELLPRHEHEDYFRKLRRDYPCRREFGARQIELAGKNSDVASQLTALGFSVTVCERGA